MIGGLGTQMKSPFGWKCDSSTGEPEAYYWQGTVRTYTPLWNYNSNTNSYSVSWSYNIDGTKSNKLYKLTFDHTNRKVSRTLVWDAKDVFVNSNSDRSKTFGNLEFISRDTFLITEEYSPADPGGNVNDTYRKAILWANKIEDDGTVTPKVWSRIIIEDFAVEGANPQDNQFDYPGTILGVSSISPTSELYDQYSKYKNILVLTAPGQYGYPWFQGNNSFHARYFLRLDSDGEDIKNTDYLADSGAWNGVEAPGTLADWKLVNTIGSEGDPSSYGADEGWMTMTSDSSVVYGNVQGYKDNSSGQCYRQGNNSGYWSQNPGSTGIYYNSCNGDFDNGQSSQPAPQFDPTRIYFHDIGLVQGLQFPIEEFERDNFGNHVVCKLDAGYSADYQNGFWYPYNISNNTSFGPNGDGSGSGAGEGGGYFYYWNNKTFGDGACCDWFAETKWGQEHGKDVILIHVARNNHQCTLLAPDDGFDATFTTNREGILVIKRDGDTNNFIILDNDDFSRDNDDVYTDINGYRKVTYEFDSSWGTIYTSPCCEDSSGNCIPIVEGGVQSSCANRPTFVWNDSGFTNGQYDWENWSEKAVQEANSGDANGNIPTFIGSSYPWTVQPFTTAISGGLSFRPNWKI